MSEQEARLVAYGDYLARRENYFSVNGIEAIYFYVVFNLGWSPLRARQSSMKELYVVLAEEMRFWEPPRGVGF